MPQTLFISALFTLLAPFSNLSAQALFDCDLLLGTWVGEYTYEDGEYSRWEADYGAEGVFSILFFDEGGSEVGRQIGGWQCDGTWVISTAVDQGQEYTFEYQIRALDSFRYLYESAQGPLFTSYRKQGDR
jgi:hypothetical protein|tara:strand:- start:64950 stop:65339 length:390 start_codon:yes stop_codon:yes gene_type:complete